MGAQHLAHLRPVERVDSLTRAEFRKTYLMQSRPVLIAGGVRHWPAVERWTIESLVERLGDRPVVVGTSTDRVFSYDLESSRINYIAMPFSAAVDRLRDPNADELVYIMQRTLERDLPELVDDVSPPAMLAGDVCWPHFWAGGAGLSTPLHWDNLHNLFGQIIGRKRFLLAAPDDLDKLYPYPAAARYAHISYADPEDPAGWPLIQEIPWFECVVGPGDLLFIPAFWWHHVRSLDLAVSVNYWWSPGLSHCLVPAFLRGLSQSFTRDRLAGVFSPITTFPGGALGAAHSALRRGHVRFSVLFAAKSLEDAVRQSCRGPGVPTDEGGTPRDLRTLVSELDARGEWPDDARPLFPCYERLIDAARSGSTDDVIDPPLATEFLAHVKTVVGALEERGQVLMRKREG